MLHSLVSPSSENFLPIQPHAECSTVSLKCATNCFYTINPFCKDYGDRYLNNTWSTVNAKDLACSEFFIF